MYTHTNIPFTGPAAISVQRMDLCHLRATECPNVHIISPQVVALLFTQTSIYSLLTSIMNEFQQTSTNLWWHRWSLGDYFEISYISYIVGVVEGGSVDGMPPQQQKERVSHKQLYNGRKWIPGFVFPTVVSSDNWVASVD